ncbi:MAG: hypothetical protein II218_09580 [Peptococcaceae bacterium]|nr:hypothetical protein [Peptococcaceae bacterium]
MTDKYRNPQAEKEYYERIENIASFPFSFCCNDVTYTGFPEEYFSLLSRDVVESDDKVTSTFTFALNETLHIKLLYVFYPLHGASDWTVTFSNPGKENSGILSNARTTLQFEGSYPMIKGILGDHDNWYRPYAMDLTSEPVYFETYSGRPTHQRFPYFNLEYGDRGAMLVIGWSGSWRADFRYDKKTKTTTYTARSVNMRQKNRDLLTNTTRKICARPMNQVPSTNSGFMKWSVWIAALFIK